MAISGGPFLTSARVIVQMLPPNKRRFRGIMAYAGALTVGNGLAPLCASIAVSHDRWPAIFVMLAVLAALAGAVGTLALPAEVTPVEGRSQSQPLLVLILMAGACLSLYALLRASYDFYSDGLQLLLAVIMGLLALYYFVRHQYHHEQPLLVVRRLVNARYIAGMGVFGLGYMVLGANNYMLPVLMQSALGFPWEVVGRVQSAGLIVATPIFAIQVAIMMKNLSAKKFYVTGFTFLTLSGLWMVHLNEQAGLWTDVWPGIALFGAFITPVMVTTALHSFIDLQADERAFGNGQQIKNMLSQFGVAIGVAGAALGLQWRNSEHLAVLVQRFSPDDATFSGLAGRLGGQFVASHGAQAAQVAVGTLAQQVNQQVVLLSSLDYFGVLAAIGVLGALMMVTQRVLK
jgi:MFS family permease